MLERNLPYSLKLIAPTLLTKDLTSKTAYMSVSNLHPKAVNALEITGGVAAVREKTSVRTNILSADQESYFADYAARIAKDIAIPVILDGGNRSLEVMEHWANQTNISLFLPCADRLLQNQLWLNVGMKVISEKQSASPATNAHLSAEPCAVSGEMINVNQTRIF